MFFDNLSIKHYTGPMLEETHYYPFGLTMAGISSKAIGKVENRYKFDEGTERTTDLDINLDETDYRSYDPQIGRFWQIDPLAELVEEWSPYTYAMDNPILMNDPLGLLSDSSHPQILQNVTVVAHKNDCKTCNSPSPSAKFGPPPATGSAKLNTNNSTGNAGAKAEPINYIHWPSSTKEERAEWNSDQTLYFDRSTSDHPLIQGGESQHYLESLDMYKRWTEAEKQHKGAQGIAVGAIALPFVLMGGIELYYSNVLYNSQLRLYFEASKYLNRGARTIIDAVRQSLQRYLTRDQIIRLEKLAEKYRDLNRFIKDTKMWKDLFDNIKKIIDNK